MSEHTAENDATCAPRYGSCALLFGHAGPHHGYPEDIDAVVKARLAPVLAEVEAVADEWSGYGGLALSIADDLRRRVLSSGHVIPPATGGVS